MPKPKPFTRQQFSVLNSKIDATVQLVQRNADFVSRRLAFHEQDLYLWQRVWFVVTVGLAVCMTAVAMATVGETIVI